MVGDASDPTDRGEKPSPADAPAASAGPEELSLKQLSEAYAEVLRQQNQDPDTEPRPDTDAAADSGSPNATDDPAFASAEAEKSNREAVGAAATLDSIDAADNAPCPISPESIIEAVLFVGTPEGTRMTAKKLAALMRDVSPAEVKRTIAALNHEYERDNAAFRIVIDGEQIEMKLTDDLTEVQNVFSGRNRAVRLSQSAVDVLAIVAWNQPVTRNRIDNIRGRPGSGVLSQLIKRGLVSVEGDRPTDRQYRTTDRFLELFGLETLEDLPQTSVVSDLEELTDFV